MNIMIAEL